MQAPDVRERLTSVGLVVDYAGAEEFAGYLKEQKARFADIIKQVGIKLD